MTVKSCSLTNVLQEACSRYALKTPRRRQPHKRGGATAPRSDVQSQGRNGKLSDSSVRQCASKVRSQFQRFRAWAHWIFALAVCRESSSTTKFPDCFWSLVPSRHALWPTAKLQPAARFYCAIAWGSCTREVRHSINQSHSRVHAAQC